MPSRRIFPRLSGFRRLALATALSLALSAPAQASEPNSLLALFSSAQPLAQEESRVEEALAVQELRPDLNLPTPIDLTLETDDLWQRIRNGFAMPNLNNDLVLTYQQWYMNRPESLRRVVQRSSRYMHHIVEELEKRGMPTELALLPMVESAYNPMALSPAQASGLWQFIPSTGKTYKLEQNWWQDQRRDIVASTTAALDYLQNIYEMHGDWQLALASYNWGEGAVKRAIEKNAARGLPTDYSSLTMPNETRHYVPKLQALKNIFSNPRLMAELKLPELLNRPYFAMVESHRPIDVATAARLAGMPLQEFVALNPSHNRPVIKADTPLVLPTDKVETFQANLENHDEPLTRWQTYTLKPGEKLDKLAPRFGISLTDLKRVNGIQGQLRIATGATLLVPTGKSEASADDTPAPPPRLPQIIPRAQGKKLLAGKSSPLKFARTEKTKPGKLLVKTEKIPAVKLSSKAGKPQAGRLAQASKATSGKLAAAPKASPKTAAPPLARAGKEKKALAIKPAPATPKIVKSASNRRI